MIKRPTWIMLIVLLLLIIVYFVIKDRASAISTEATSTPMGDIFLVTQEDGTLQSLRIVDQQNQIFQMQRDTGATWTISFPISGIADQSLAAATESQVDALRIVTSLDNSLNLIEAGLDSPAYTIHLAFVSGLEHVIQVGALTPTNSGYYVRYDGGNLYVVSQPGIDALLNLLTSPPFPATETPIPTDEGSPVPTIEIATSTP